MCKPRTIQPVKTELGRIRLSPKRIRNVCELSLRRIASSNEYYEEHHDFRCLTGILEPDASLRQCGTHCTDLNRLETHSIMIWPILTRPIYRKKQKRGPFKRPNQP